MASRSGTGSRRSAARRSATGSRSASRAATRCATSRRRRASCRRRAPSAASRCAAAAPPAARASRRRSRSSARSAARSSARRSSSAARSASPAADRLPACAGSGRATGAQICRRGPSGIRQNTRTSSDDLREADHGDGVVLGDLAVVELPEPVGELVGAADLRVVVLDLARRELAEALDLDLVDHGVEDLLALPVADADEHGHDHPLLVLRRLVAEPDRRGLALRAELVGDDRRVEVERVHRHAGTIASPRALRAPWPSRARPGRRAVAAPRRAAASGLGDLELHAGRQVAERPRPARRKNETTLKTRSPSHV